MPLPMSPTQAAILGRQAPAPIATVNAPTAGGLPITPAQLAVLTGQTQVQQPSPTAPPATPAMASPFAADPMAEFLLQRANRPGDIRSGTGLIGRLAALGVGLNLDKRNQQGAQQQALDLVSTLPPEQQDVARLAVLSGDPQAAVQAIMQAQRITAQTKESEVDRAFKAEQKALDREAAAERFSSEWNTRRAMQTEDLALRERIAVSEQAIAQQKLAIDQQEAALPDYKEANNLQDDFRAESKEFKVISTAMRRLNASVEDPSPAGDLALIFNYMKMLDPNSVVRESEFATADNAGSVPERIRGLYNRVVEGTRLSEAQRGDFVNRAGRLFVGAREGHESLEEEFSKLAGRRGVPIDDFMVDYMGDLRALEPRPFTPEEAAEVNAPAPPPGFEPD